MTGWWLELVVRLELLDGTDDALVDDDSGVFAAVVVDAVLLLFSTRGDILYSEKYFLWNDVITGDVPELLLPCRES